MCAKSHFPRPSPLLSNDFRLLAASSLPAMLRALFPFLESPLMSRLLAGAVGLVVFSSAFAQQAPLTLEQIMADPDWIATSIEVPEPFDDRGLFRRQRRALQLRDARLDC